jgi:hypothetical protein
MGWSTQRRGRGDELDHVVGELAGTVGRGQALDQLRPSVAVLEREDLLAVDRRAHDETRDYDYVLREALRARRAPGHRGVHAMGVTRRAPSVPRRVHRDDGPHDRA